MTEKKKVAILISGRGSNMAALIEATGQADFPAKIVGVISNRPDAEGLATARERGLPTAVFQLKAFRDKESCDAAITRQLDDWAVDIVCLAGFMRILSAGFTHRWAQKLINIHPSLLPKFKGTDTHQRALDAGETEHGCSVHFVVSELDAGPVIARATVPVKAGDTAETLADRVLHAEHKLYPEALRLLASGQIKPIVGPPN